MAVGDSVTFLDGPDAMNFGAVSTITGVIPFDESDEKGRRTTKIELGPAVHLPEGLSRDLMQFSLTIVRNTKSPQVHFRRGYRLLPKEDFETLKTGEAFVARSGYFELLNALPQGLRAAFEAHQIIARNGESRAESYRNRLESLQSFLDQRVFAVGRLLVELDDAVRALALVDSRGVTYEHRFESDEVPQLRLIDRSDDLSEQLRRFAGLQQELNRSLTEQDGATEQSSATEQSGVVKQSGSTAQSGVPEQGGDSERNVLLRTLDALGQPSRRAAENRFERLFARTE